MSEFTKIGERFLAAAEIEYNTPIAVGKQEYIVEGWDSDKVRVRKFVGGLAGPDALFLRFKRSPPTPPDGVSRAEFYRWLATLEEQGITATMTERCW